MQLLAKRQNHDLAHPHTLQEIIQNADDAGASTVHFYLDNRQHRSQSLINPSLAQFQGPALLSYNDAMFQEKDWQSIQDMQQSVKADDPFKVGKFGIGFNSVYHITGVSIENAKDNRLWAKQNQGGRLQIPWEILNFVANMFI